MIQEVHLLNFCIPLFHLLQLRGKKTRLSLSLYHLSGMMGYTMRIHYIKLFFAAVIWGGALVAGRVIAGNLPPFTITFLRFSLVSLFLLPLLYLRTGHLPRPSVKGTLLVVLVSLSGVVAFNYFMFAGLRTVTAVRSSVIIAFTPAVVALAAGLFFGERLTLLKILGFLSALLGALVTITDGRLLLLFSQSPSVGDLFLLGCVFTWAVYSFSTKFALRHLSPLAVLTYASVLGAVLLLPPALAEGALGSLAGRPPAIWFSLIYLSLGAAGLAYLWYYEGIEAVGASGSVIFLNLEPVSAILLGVLILGEQLTLPVVTGAALVLTGLVLTGHPSARKPT